MADRKFMFDVDFGHPQGPPKQAAAMEAVAEEEAVIEDEPPPPTFTEEELSLARDSAFEQGRQAGLTEAGEATDRMMATALASLSTQMDAVFRGQEAANDTNSRNAVKVALAVMRKVLPAACEKYAFDEVARVVEEVVAHILDEPRIIVRVAALLVEPVQERLEAVAERQGFEGRVVVQADGRLAPGDARVEWTDGGAERDQARLLDDIEATVERSLAPPERRADAACVHEGEEFAGT